MIDSAGVSDAVKELGLESGHHVLVHSSLSAMGYVEDGAAGVVRGLLDAVGVEGTVLAPTLTGSDRVGPTSTVEFDAELTPSWTGAVAECVRIWPGAVRSLHPTHSVAAVGFAADRLTRGHQDSITPCGPRSPFTKLAEDPDGVILLLGCDHSSNTTLHAVEELAGVSYHLQEQPVSAHLVRGTLSIDRSFWAHRYGTPRHFALIEPLLVERGIQRTGRVGEATARLVRAGDLVSIGLEVLRADPEFFVRAV